MTGKVVEGYFVVLVVDWDSWRSLAMIRVYGGPKMGLWHRA